jgi:hypothetical protein
MTQPMIWSLYQVRNTGNLDKCIMCVKSGRGLKYFAVLTLAVGSLEIIIFTAQLLGRSAEI